MQADMEGVKDIQEVTVEVVPQTVTEIIYLSEQDMLNSEPNYYIPSEEELEEDEQTETYEIGSVDPARLQHMSLILDESQSFVLLSQPEECFEVSVDTKASESEHSYSDSDDDYRPRKLKQYKCDVCNTKCHSKKTLNCHKLLHNSNLAVLQPIKSECVCKVCGVGFDKAQALSHHFRTSHEPPKLICNICGCPCTNDSALLAHYKKHEPKQFSCDLCNSGYDNPVDLNNHKKTHSTDLLYACNKCDAEFASTAAVSAHLRYVHARPRTVQSNVKNSESSFRNELNNPTPVKVQNRFLKSFESKKHTHCGNDEENAFPTKPKRKKR